MLCYKLIVFWYSNPKSESTTDDDEVSATTGVPEPITQVFRKFKILRFYLIIKDTSQDTCYPLLGYAYQTTEKWENGLGEKNKLTTQFEQNINAPFGLRDESYIKIIYKDGGSKLKIIDNQS